MKAHSNEFKEEIKTLGRQQTVRITYTLNNETKIINSEDINSATPNYEGNLLKSVMKELDLDSNIDIPKDTEIKFEYGLLTNGEYEYLNYGNYIVYSSEKQEDTLSYNIKCYDKLLYSMKDYEELDIVYPKTIKQYLIALCTKIGLEFKDSTFANQDREITNDLFKGLNYTYRDVLDQIAETTGGCICLTLDDKVEVRYINKLVNYEEIKETNETTFNSEIEENLIINKVYGKTKQEATEGYNLCPSFDSGTWNLGNGAFIKDDILTLPNVNSTATSDFIEWNYFNSIKIQFFLNSGNNYHISLAYFDENKKYITENGRAKKDATSNEVIDVDVNIPENLQKAKFVKFQFRRSEQYAVNAYSVKNVQISKEDKPYEPYTGGMSSPNPSYPQKIKNVGDNINLFDIEKLVKMSSSYSKVENGYIFKAHSDMFHIGVDLEMPISLPISISYNVKNGTGTNFRLRFWFNDGSTQALTDYKSGTDTEEHTIVINNFTRKGATKITKIGFDWSNVGTFTVTNFKIEEGTQVTPYSDCNCGNISIKVQNEKNKLNVTATSKTFTEGITVTVNEDKSITINGTNNSSSTLYFRLADNFVLPAGSYTLSNKNSNTSNDNFIFYDDNNKFPRKNISNATFTEDVTIKPYIKILYGATVNNQTIYPMIVEGAYSETTLPAYESYQEQTKVFPLAKGQKLMEGDYLADDGIHHQRKQIVLDGTENWKVLNGYTHTFTLNLKPYSRNGICTHYKNIVQKDFDTNTGIYLFISGSAIISDIRFSNVDKFKEYLAEQYSNGVPVTIEYIMMKNDLATIDWQISPYTLEQQKAWKDIQKIISYKGENHLNASANIDFKFPINFEMIDEEYINDTNVNFREKYGPINSIVLARAGEADKIYKKDQESIEQNGLCELAISENQFMNLNDRSDYLDELAEKLFGVSYYINDFVSTGIMYYDLLDMYGVKIGDNTYKCLMLNDEQLITQGLEENIYTDMPEKSETDYTKADKTDRKINQTYLIVDKQNQQIEGVINQIGDRTDKTTTITADIDGLASKVSTIVDLTDDITGIKKVNLEKCVTGEIVELHIYGNNSVFKYQVLSNDLYLNDNLLLGKDKSIIIVTDEEGNKTYNNLQITEVLRQKGSVYDEYILKDGQAQIIRRINKDGTVKDNEEIENLGEFHIPVLKGNNTLEIKDFSANIYVKWAIQNEYTDIFATRAEMNSNIKQTSQEISLSVNKKFENYSTTTEMNSAITQTAESINSEVRKKVGEDEIISKINQSAEAVSIDAQKININGTISANGNFQVDTDGNMICNNGQFNGGKVTLLDNPEDDDSRLEITSSGAETKIFSDGLYINNSSGSANLRIRIACS